MIIYKFGVHLLRTFISACKISANRTKKQVYLHFSEVQPNFNLQKQVKVGAKSSEISNLFEYLSFSSLNHYLLPILNIDTS